MRKTKQKLIETETTINTINSRGKPIQITKVKALKNLKTGKLMVHPSEVAKAEIRQIAECFGIIPRDVGTLMMLLAKPGIFNEGDVFYKYHLQKMMFYMWKFMEKVYVDSLSFDKFIPADNGPVPAHLNEDLKRFESNNLIRTHYEKWEDEEKNLVKSKRIILTEKGKNVAEALWCELPRQYKILALRAKKLIYPLSPSEVRELVHKQYPEYRDTYIKNDIE